MQIVSSGNNLPVMSKAVFWEMSAAENFTQSAKC